MYCILGILSCSFLSLFHQMTTYSSVCLPPATLSPTIILLASAGFLHFYHDVLYSFLIAFRKKVTQRYEIMWTSNNLATIFKQGLMIYLILIIQRSYYSHPHKICFNLLLSHPREKKSCTKNRISTISPKLGYYAFS